MSDQDRPSSEEESAALRAELQRVQEAARQSLSHLRDEVDFLRQSQDPARDADSVTTQVALEQEIDALRRTLKEKERQMESTATQCRHLEDDLEDQRLANDGLKQDLERSKHSLALAREQVAHLSRERYEIEARLQAVQSSEQSVQPSGKGAERRTEKPQRAQPGTAKRFVGGLVAGGVVVAVGFVAWTQLFSPPGAHTRPPRGEESASPTQNSTAEASTAGEPSEPQGSASTSPGDESPAGNESPAIATGEKRPAPGPVKKVRDRLRGGSAGPVMLVIEGGNFEMGKKLALPSEDSGPRHSVHVDSFLIGATEVTFEEYDRFVRATGYRVPRDYGWGRGSRPVVDISWNDVHAYLRWLSQRTGKRYRLPSESEWEYAAAAGQESFFWWGNEPGQGRAVCFDCGTRWDNRSTAPVASFAPNPFGLYDTAGNAMEWVEDCYHPSYEGAPPNGRPWGMLDCALRVARGGAFNKPDRSMHSTARSSFAPDTRINALGFRVARDE